MDEVHSSSVSILDCKSHIWLEAPRMRVERRNPKANVLNGKIYVTGDCKDFNSSNLMEVFDPKAQTWESVSEPDAWIYGCNILKRLGLEGEIFRDFGYKPKKGSLKRVRWEMNSWLRFPYCVIEDVLYNYNVIERKIQWYDTKVRVWRKVLGLNRRPRFGRCTITMVNYDGKMAVFWDKIVTFSGKKNKIIRCAVVKLKRRNSKEIWGKVQWHKAVLSVPMSYYLYHSLAPTV